MHILFQAGRLVKNVNVANTILSLLTRDLMGIYGRYGRNSFQEIEASVKNTDLETKIALCLLCVIWLRS